MKTQIFLQARIGSTRLPGKVLMKIAGKSIFELTVERLRRVKGVDSIVLVTGPQEKNFALVQEAKRIVVAYFCGSEENLLDRFYRAALQFAPDAIMRITGDCPLIDAGVLSEGIAIFKKGKYDMVSNVRERTYPHGLDFELFTFAALKKSWSDQDGANLASSNPTQYMMENKEFSHFNMLNQSNLSHIRITLDYAEDFELIEKIYHALYKKGEYFGLHEILKFLEENPQLLEINKKHIRLDYGLRPEY